MKILILSILIMGQAFANDLFLVTNQEPHLLEHLMPKVKIEINNGRTLVVSKIKGVKYSQEEIQSLQSVDKSEIYNSKFISSIVLPKDPVIESMVNNVTAEKMEHITEKIASFGKRKAGTDDNVMAANYIESEMKTMGLKTSQDCFRRKTCNVYGLLEGGSKAEELIIVEAHLDSVGRENAGADDNASGIAGLLLIAKNISQLKLSRSVLFFATNGEEKGLLGAKHYVKTMKKNGKINTIKFVINMDMIGYNKTNKLVDLETNKDFVDYAMWMATLVNTYTSLEPNIVTPAWGSDHVPFLNEDIPSVLTIEHWPTKTPCYHSSCDTADHLTYEYGKEIIKLNIAATYLSAQEKI